TITPPGQGIGTILDVNGPVLSIDAVPTTVVEGDSGTPHTARFRISVADTDAQGMPTNVSPKDVTVRFATANGPSTPFLDILVPIIGNTMKQPDRIFFMNLSSPSQGTTISAGQAQATILDDD